MLVGKDSSTPRGDNAKAKDTRLVEVFLRQLGGECKPLRPVMLNSLLILAKEYDWAISAILDVGYIRTLEQYCKTASLSTFPPSLPRLLYLLELEVRSNSTDSSSKLVPFAGQLCSMLAERVSQIKSLFTESSLSDPTNTALSTTLHDESPHLTRDAALEMLYEGLTLLKTLLSDRFFIVEEVLIKFDFVPFLKSTIITLIVLIMLWRSDLLIKVLDRLCSLLERTCRRSSPTRTSHLKVIINISSAVTDLTPNMLKEDLVQRVIVMSKPAAVPTTHAQFHLRLICSLVKLIHSKNRDWFWETDWTRIRILHFERALKPAKQYLQFILQREEFIPQDNRWDPELSYEINALLRQTLTLERDLIQHGEIVETGREEWEVGWLVEKTVKNATPLSEILNRHFDCGKLTRERNSDVLHLSPGFFEILDYPVMSTMLKMEGNLSTISIPVNAHIRTPFVVGTGLEGAGSSISVIHCSYHSSTSPELLPLVSTFTRLPTQTHDSLSTDTPNSDLISPFLSVNGAGLLLSDVELILGTGPLLDFGSAN
ncbi:hypothetical protein BLNAU_17583 [Blattamonas nauphoetae]|uniref:Uncharacterized protein n=1 Tax=Blattamonas nauphoetae TaxID=2049346 RepID=A0ABQ9X724_9EUKA|nr:hypothetical protein BLNAU_17583 [Blattamonas nauphoetae]